MSPQSMPRSSEEVQTTARSAPGGHGGLDLAPLLDREAAMVEGDRQVRLVQPPQRAEHQLGLGAGVDEHQRDLAAPAISR